MTSAFQFRQHAKDHPPVNQAIAVQPGPEYFGSDAACAARCVAEIDPAVFGEVRVQGNVEQAALAARFDRRQPGHCLCQQGAILDDAQPPRSFRHQEPAIRQESHAPRVFEPCGDGVHTH